ncbi:MAG: hypothetical protein V4721_03300 [Bacteroidota bacterium]
MFEEYKEAVVRDYQFKMADGTLSLNLTKPTPANIKREWLIVFAGRRSIDDLKTLRLFFGEKQNDEEYERAIRNIDVDRFRPLCKFLNNETKNPEDKFIELLAWLVGFAPRPYQTGYNYVRREQEKEDPKASPNETETMPPDDISKIHVGSSADQITIVKSEKSKIDFLRRITPSKKQGVVILIIVGIIITGAFLYRPKTDSSLLSLLNSQECMYWDGLQYIQADCGTALPQVQLIALERNKLNNFKKIIRPDTLILSDINRVWYLKTNHQLELFTGNGVHPEQPSRDLRRLSEHMFKTYVLTGKVKID